MRIKPVKWTTVERECLQEALSALAAFRKENPRFDRVLAPDLSWCYTWDDVPVLLDMSRPVFDRVQTRLSRTSIYVGVALKGRPTTKVVVPLVPHTVFCLLAEEEEARQSLADEE